jgi:hypothetical protein
MRNLMITGLATLALFATSAAFAKETTGKGSQGAVRNFCNSQGGDLLGVSDSGSYGCEVASTGVLILCNKSDSCTVYTSARTAARNRVFRLLNASVKATSKS